MDLSTWLSVAPPARTSASPASELAWTERVVTSPCNLVDLLADRAPGGWSGRTSPASSRLMQVEISEPSSPVSPDTPSEPSLPPLLAAGEILASLPLPGPTVTASRGECLTLSTSEFPNGGAASSLSDILETGDVPQRYFLSATACRGILRRAEKRGKELPAQLQLALSTVAGIATMPTPPTI
jgi:hypothetical protein